MIKMGEIGYEWVLLHIRNGEELAGLVEVPADLKEDDKLYKRFLAAEIVQPKVFNSVIIDRVIPGENPGSTVGTEPVKIKEEGTADRIVELRNPHRVITQIGDGKQVIAVMPLNLGDKVIFLRASEILYPQFLDAKSPIVIDIRRTTAGLETPLKEGESRTDSGLILPGAARP